MTNLAWVLVFYALVTPLGWWAGAWLSNAVDADTVTWEGRGYLTPTIIDPSPTGWDDHEGLI